MKKINQTRRCVIQHNNGKYCQFCKVMNKNYFVEEKRCATIFKDRADAYLYLLKHHIYTWDVEIVLLKK